MLLKPTATLPHGGGRRLVPGSPEIGRRPASDCPGNAVPVGGRTHALPAGHHARPADPPPERPAAIPDHRRVRRRRPDRRDPADAVPDQLADLAIVDERGQVEVRLTAWARRRCWRFGDAVAVAQLTVPDPGQPYLSRPPRGTPSIRSSRKLAELGIPPSPTCTDSEFARRSSLDIRGRLPEAAAVVAFQRDPDPDKRGHRVDRMIDSPEYADLFAMKLVGDPQEPAGPLGTFLKAGTFGFHAWIRQSLAENKPFDQFAADLDGGAATPA